MSASASPGFTRLPPDLAKDLGDPGFTVVTGTDRAAEEVRWAHGLRQREAGKSAWRTPTALSWTAWLRRRAPESVLDGVDEFLLWRALAPADREHLASMALEAWERAHDWGLDWRLPASDDSSGSRMFRDWAERVTGWLAANGRESLSACAVAAQPDERLRLYGISQLTPRQRALAGDAPAQPEPLRASSIRKVRFDSEADEMRAVARWARGVLLESPQATVGVLLPGIGRRRVSASHAFGVEFAPDDPNSDESGLYSLLAAGLVDQPAWRSAELLLRHLRRPTPASRRALRSAPLLRSEQSIRCSEVKDGDLRTLPEWAKWASEELERAGWGAGAGAAQRQALRSAEGMLRAAAESVAPSATMEALSAVRALRDLAFRQRTSPVSCRPSVLVLSPDALDGLCFDHLWVAGASDADWPRPGAPHPLLSAGAQQERGVSGVTPASAAEQAVRQRGAWLRSCRHLTVSWAVGDAESGLSPLLRGLPYDVEEDGAVVDWHPRLRGASGAALERRPADLGTACEPGAVRGGSTLVKNQALCPFRAWAVHRLEVADERDESVLPDPLARGLLAHDALHRLYRDAERPFAPEDFQSAAQGAVSELLPTAPEAFRASERRRLADLLSDWSDLEDRQGWADHMKVDALEQTVDLNVAGAQFRLRVDRRDAAESGERVVLDYKTGSPSAASLAAPLLQGRLVDPQLPMYALADESVKGVYFAGVGSARKRLDGFSADSVPLPSRKVDRAEPVWDELRSAWRRQLRELVEEYLGGVATVAPHAPSACRLCHLKPLCRIHELEAASAAEVDHE